MPWGAQFRALLALRVAATASALFWLGLIVFIAIEFAFDGEGAPARWWLQPLDDGLIFLVWVAACVATASCIWAMGAGWHRNRTSMEPVRTPGIASAKEGGRCSAL